MMPTQKRQRTAPGAYPNTQTAFRAGAGMSPTDRDRRWLGAGLHAGTARPILAVGALCNPGPPVLMGSAILFDVLTGICTTDAHVVLDCATEGEA